MGSEKKLRVRKPSPGLRSVEHRAKQSRDIAISNWGPENKDEVVVLFRDDCARDLFTDLASLSKTFSWADSKRALVEARDLRRREAKLGVAKIKPWIQRDVFLAREMLGQRPRSSLRGDHNGTPDTFSYFSTLVSQHMAPCTLLILAEIPTTKTHIRTQRRTRLNRSERATSSLDNCKPISILSFQPRAIRGHQRTGELVATTDLAPFLFFLSFPSPSCPSFSLAKISSH